MILINMDDVDSEALAADVMKVVVGSGRPTAVHPAK